MDQAPKALFFDVFGTLVDWRTSIARESELILTSLPGPREVEAVALGSNGIVHGAIAGTIYADLSTGSPTVMRKLYAAFKDRGVHVLDAPVSGGVWGAQRGSLQVMVGGDEAIHGVLDMMSAGVTAQVMKWAVPIHPTVSELLPTLIDEARAA